MESGGFVDAEVHLAEVARNGDAVGCVVTCHLQALLAHIFKLNGFAVTFFADIHFGHFVACLVEFSDRAGECLVIFHAHIVEIHHIGYLLEHVVDKRNLDGLALIGVEVDF